MMARTASGLAASAAVGVGNAWKNLEMHSCFVAQLDTTDMSTHATRSCQAS